MANNSQNYRTFTWENQLINLKPVQSVIVRIFRPLEEVTADNFYQLVDTDGIRVKKSHWSPKTYIRNYSYVILSTGMWEKQLYSKKFYTLCLKLYLTADFDPSMLQKEFLGKNYLLEAYNQLPDTDLVLTPPPKPEPDLLNYLKKKVGNEAEELYLLLQESAQAQHFALIEKLFKNYGISDKYQAVFWKKMYQSKTF